MIYNVQTPLTLVGGIALLAFSDAFTTFHALPTQSQAFHGTALSTKLQCTTVFDLAQVIWLDLISLDLKKQQTLPAFLKGRL